MLPEAVPSGLYSHTAAAFIGLHTLRQRLIEHCSQTQEFASSLQDVNVQSNTTLDLSTVFSQIRELGSKFNYLAKFSSRMFLMNDLPFFLNALSYYHTQKESEFRALYHTNILYTEPR